MALKQGNWNKVPGLAMNEATIGVIGVGAIGRAVLKRANLGAKLLAPTFAKRYRFSFRNRRRDDISGRLVSAVRLHKS